MTPFRSHVESVVLVESCDSREGDTYTRRRTQTGSFPVRSNWSGLDIRGKGPRAHREHFSLASARKPVSLQAPNAYSNSGCATSVLRMRSADLGTAEVNEKIVNFSFSGMRDEGFT